ncbi:amidoligase family protein [Indioceanicola profundi]|uniref:amidoligase family protein n=1 Tax=Indioceanicola profundi TaxID=2220096 RepID=UPI0013C4A8EE|nr:amidoligase family protein [Indioceanicola profundi]
MPSSDVQSPVFEASPPLKTAILAPLDRADNIRATRRVGVEVEFTSLGARAAAYALTTAWGGTVEREDAQAYVARGTALGDLAVELDVRHLHPKRHPAVRLPQLGEQLAAVAGWMLHRLVPCELITAPRPVDRLTDVDLACAALRRAGARGAGATAFASLGMHLNIEAPCLEAGYLTAVLKAYLLLEAWLRRETQPAKQVWAPHRPQRFPHAYVRQVIAPDYWPDMDRFIRDYLTANPTRDRGLDFLPLLLHLDEAQVRSRLPYEKIGARPAFHYRLPLAYVGDPAWSIRPDWTRWLAVEVLADDPEKLMALGELYLCFQGTSDAWADMVMPDETSRPCSEPKNWSPTAGTS